MADKEIINVASITVSSKEYKGQSTKKKVLTLDNGEEIPVTEKNGAFKYISVAGQYEITRNSYGSLATAKLLKKDANAKAPSEEYPVPKESDFKNTASKGNTPYVQAVRQPSEFEKNRQKEITMMCYAGIAKDILIAMKKDFSPESVFEFSKSLYEKHVEYFTSTKDKVINVIPNAEVVNENNDVPF